MLVPRQDFAEIHALCKHIVMTLKLKQFVCPQSTIHRRSGLVMDLVVFLLIEPTTPFTLVTNPGNFPVYNNYQDDP
jgi:hypothetical protein